MEVILNPVLMKSKPDPYSLLKFVTQVRFSRRSVFEADLNCQFLTIRCIACTVIVRVLGNE